MAELIPEAAGSLLGAEMLRRVLGPTASYLGEEIQSWVEQRKTNISRIFNSADRKLQLRGNIEGSVPPRILNRVLEDGSFCDDELVGEYYGGVLASSKSGIARDDRGYSYIKIIGQLSVYQLRAHYLIYGSMKRLFGGSGLEFGKPNDRKMMGIFIPSSVFMTAMAYDAKELSQSRSIGDHILDGLAKEYLIDKNFGAGNISYVRSIHPLGNDSGVFITPSSLGSQLFLWANGRSDLDQTEFLTRDFKFEFVEGVIVPEGVEAFKFS